MNFELSDEQIFLREAARGALSRVPTLEAARAALDGEPLPDLWPAACDAGWPGIAIGEEHGGAGLGAFDAMLVMWECGRVLASVPLLGHITATALLDRCAGDRGELLASLASGERKAAIALARPGSGGSGWTVDPRGGPTRAGAPTAKLADGRAELHGSVAWVPDLPGADVVVVVAVSDDGQPVAALVEPGADGVSAEPVMRYDATRALGHLTLDGAQGDVLDVPDTELTAVWHLAQALLAAEAVGSVERALELSVAYAQERFTFGRPIGSYQAVKHALVEVMRLLENARSLIYYAGWAYEDAPGEFGLAAGAARVSAGKALDFGARQLISVHGGIGATWEHDAPLYFRRAQLSRRLLGGTGAAADTVAGELLAEARAAA